MPIWWQQNQLAFERYQNLQVWNIDEQAVAEMAKLVSRNMSLQYNISDGEVWLSSDDGSVHIVPEQLK